MVTAGLRERILSLLNAEPGLTDREITDRLRGRGQPQQPVNQECRRLADQGFLVRRTRGDGLIGNYPAASRPTLPSASPPRSGDNGTDEGDFGEDALKRTLDTWLQGQGWETEIAWGKSRGVDIRALRGGERWIIEVKGKGSRPEMRVNYFLAILGELLQRMDDPDAAYSIALPDLPQFRGLWNRLPAEAKVRTRISALFVGRGGKVIREAP